jgi:hypothetical protein
MPGGAVFARLSANTFRLPFQHLADQSEWVELKHEPRQRESLEGWCRREAERLLRVLPALRHLVTLGHRGGDVHPELERRGISQLAHTRPKAAPYV